MLPLNPKSKSDWIKAIDAVHLLSKSSGGDKRSKKLILERLKDGGISATAWWVAHAVDVGRPYNRFPELGEYDINEKIPVVTPAETEAILMEKTKPVESNSRYGDHLAFSVSSENIILGGAFWRCIDLNDRVNCNWSDGFFLTKYSASKKTNPKDPWAKFHKYPTRMFALGVHFHKPDVIKMLDLHANIISEKKPSNAGRKMSEKWPFWVAEVVLYHHENGLSGLTATKLIDVISERSSIKGFSIPSANTVRPTVVKILEFLTEESSK